MIRYIIITGFGALVGLAFGYFGKCAGGMCPMTSSPWSGAIFGAIFGLLIATQSRAK